MGEMLVGIRVGIDIVEKEVGVEGMVELVVKFEQENEVGV